MALCPHKSTYSGARIHIETRYSFHFTRGMLYFYMLTATNLIIIIIIIISLLKNHMLSSRRDDLSRNFFLSITNPASCLQHLLPHRDVMQLHLGLDHTKFTQDRPLVQSDTVPLCKTAFLTTRTGLLSVNIHPPHFTHVDDFDY